MNFFLKKMWVVGCRPPLMKKINFLFVCFLWCCGGLSPATHFVFFYLVFWIVLSWVLCFLAALGCGSSNRTGAFGSRCCERHLSFVTLPWCKSSLADYTFRHGSTHWFWMSCASHHVFISHTRDDYIRAGMVLPHENLCVGWKLTTECFDTGDVGYVFLEICSVFSQ